MSPWRDFTPLPLQPTERHAQGQSSPWRPLTHSFLTESERPSLGRFERTYSGWGSTAEFLYDFNRKPLNPIKRKKSCGACFGSLGILRSVADAPLRARLSTTLYPAHRSEAPSGSWLLYQRAAGGAGVPTTPPAAPLAARWASFCQGRR